MLLVQFIKNNSLGANAVTTAIEKKTAQLVCISADCDPIEVVLHLPSLCRKMGIPYCIVRGGRSRLGQVARLKSCAALALTQVNPEDKVRLIRFFMFQKTY